MWWVVTDDHRVVEAEGLSCAPNNPGTWWFPKLGFSGSERFHAFLTRESALEAALLAIDTQIARLQRARDELTEASR